MPCEIKGRTTNGLTITATLSSDGALTTDQRDTLECLLDDFITSTAGAIQAMACEGLGSCSAGSTSVTEP